MQFTQRSSTLWLWGDYVITKIRINHRPLFRVAYQGTFIDDELPSLESAVKVATEHNSYHESDERACGHE